MLSPTNYHIPSHIAEGLAQYNGGGVRLEDVITQSEIDTVEGVLTEITDPAKREIVFQVGHVAGHSLLLIDDHSRPKSDLGVFR